VGMERVDEAAGASREEARYNHPQLSTRAPRK
jgi:hypothetical protein